MHMRLNKKIMASAAAGVLMAMTLQACSGDAPSTSSNSASSTPAAMAPAAMAATMAAPAALDTNPSIQDTSLTRADFAAPYTSDPFSTLQRYGQPKLTAKGQAYWDVFTPDLDPAIQCLPANLARELFSPAGVLFEFKDNGDIGLSFENVYMDGRDFPAEYAMDKRGSWPTSLLGYSIGNWEGDVLHVETRGIVERDILIGHIPILPSDQMMFKRTFTMVPVDQRWEARGLAPQEVNPFLVPDATAKTMEMVMWLDDPETLNETWQTVKQYREVTGSNAVSTGGDLPVTEEGNPSWEGTAAAAESGVPEEFLNNYDGGCVLFPEYDEDGVGDFNYVPE